MTEGHPSNQVSRLEAGFLIGFFTLLTLYVSRAIWDIDVFWHITAGRVIVESGGFPTTDIFSAIDPERTWVTFQWGYQVLVYGLEALGGLSLVKTVHSLVMLLGFAVFWFVCRQHFRLDALLSFALLALLVVLFEDRIRCRPHVFNLLAWSALSPWLLGGGALRKPKSTWAIMGVVVFLWANLHAGGAFLFLVAASTVPVGRSAAKLLGWGQQRAEKTRWAWIGFAVMAGAALLAPNFVTGNIQALTMLEASESAIGEWLPAWHFFRIGTTAGHIVCGAVPAILCVLWLLTTVGAIRDRFQRTPPWVLLLGLALCVLSQRSVRFVWIASFGLMLLWPHVPRRKLSPGMRKQVLAGASAALVAIAIQFNVYAQHGGWAETGRQAFLGPAIDLRRFPVEHADFLESTGFEGNIFCQGNWGGYLLWRLWPQVRVTADGRGNYARDVTEALDTTYDRSRFGDPAFGAGLDAIYRRYPVDAIVHQHPIWPAGYEVDRTHWVPVFQDRRGAVWIRNTERGQAYLEKLRAARAGDPTGAPSSSPE